MLNSKKSGKSLILLVIVIAVMTSTLFLVSRLYNNTNKEDKAQEEAFKLNVYEYCLELEEYKSHLATKEGYKEQELNVYGVELEKVIPNIVKTDMSKFKIEKGKLIYIGTDEQEKKWTKEVKI